MENIQIKQTFKILNIYIEHDNKIPQHYENSGVTYQRIIRTHLRPHKSVQYDTT